MKKLLLLLVAASLPALPAAQKATSHQNDVFAGTWKLDVINSQFLPGPIPMSETVTITPDRVKVHVVVNGDNGKTAANWSYPVAHNRRPVHVSGTGLSDATVTSERLNSHTISYTWNFNGLILHGKSVVSQDGRTMRYTLIGNTSQGEPIHNIEIFKKE